MKARGYGTHRCYDKYVSLRGVGDVNNTKKSDRLSTWRLLQASLIKEGKAGVFEAPTGSELGAAQWTL